MRNGDDPKLKTSVLDVLKNEVLLYLTSKGLTKDKEYIVIERHDWSAHRDTIMIDHYSKDYTLNIQFNAIQFAIFCMLVKKDDTKPDSREKIVKEEKVENLRYNISDGTELELTECSRELWEQLFEKYKIIFEELKPDFKE